MKTKLYIFDFDGTIMNTPLPDTGKLEYERITGEKYPHQGWWGRLESLHHGFDIQPFPTVVEEYNRVKSDPDGLVVLMTNRMYKHIPRVKEILNQHNLSFDVYSFKLDGTLKPGRIRKLLEEYTDVSYIEVWDDMEDQIGLLNQMKDEMTDKQIKINKVDNGRLNT